MQADKNSLIGLTLAVYRVTDLFPEREPLRYSIREAANKVIACCFTNDADGLVSNIELLKSYFSVAKTRDWLKEENFSILEKEYCALIGCGTQTLNRKLSSTANEKQPYRVKSKKTAEKVYSQDERKQKIASLITDQQKLTLKEILGQLPEINRRTLIRDLENLLKTEIIKKEGKGRATFYLPNGKSDMVPRIVTEEVSPAI